MSRPFFAAFPGRCVGGDAVAVGDKVAYVEPDTTSLFHLEDPDCTREAGLLAAQARRSAAREAQSACPACFLVHPDGACDR